MNLNTPAKFIYQLFQTFNCRFSMLFVALQVLIFSFPGDSTKTCFAVPKVCDIYDGGFMFDGAPATKCILGDQASKFGVPGPSGQGVLLESEGGVPQYVCKVRVGVGSGSEKSWWSPCDQDSCTRQDGNFAITCPAGGVDSDKGGLYF